MRKTLSTKALLLAAVSMMSTAAIAQVSPAVPAMPVPASSPLPTSIETTALVRWQATLNEFASADREHAPTIGGIVFVGSSSIRLWEGLEAGFGDATVFVKRGFGGSTLADCASLVSKLVVPYRPRTVVVYAGDNDLAEGATAQQVLGSFTRFVEAVRAALPAARIAFVSIKPSPSRAALMPEIRAANRLIAQYTSTHQNLDYIDIFTPMMNSEGGPRGELFRADALHLNDEGYALWRSVIARHLGAPGGSVKNVTASAAASSSTER